MEATRILITKLIIWLIRAYQITISPILGHHCRFSITCSQYGINSILQFGILKGIWKICIRILQCHPLNFKKNKNYHSFQHEKTKDIVNMDSQRNFFIGIFLIISFILWQTWEIEHYYQKTHLNNLKDNYTNSYLNSKISSSTPPNNIQKNIVHSENKDIITVQTDVFLLKINKYGGNIEDAYLLKYLDNLNSQQPLRLLNSSKKYQYQTYSELTTNTNLSNEENQCKKFLYTDINNQNKYILKNNKNTLQFTLMHYDPNGIIYTKQYLFHRNNYFITINHTIDNTSIHSIYTRILGNLVQSQYYLPIPLKNNKNKIYLSSEYEGSAYSTNKEKYQKYSFNDMKHNNLNIHSIGGWVALLQKYFVVAWLPITPVNNVFHTTYIDDHYMSIGFQSDLIQIPPGQKKEFQTILWIGPKIQDHIKSTIAPNLNLVIDYGWFWFISQPLFKLLQLIHNYINNWGVSIILITIIIRIIMYPLTKAQYTSMAKMRMLQPKLVLIQEKYKHNKYQCHQKTIELYKKEKVNPLGGCLPLLIQMPIFLALYYMLSNSVELRHAKFMLWINDLSTQDPYYILPIIMGITMLLIQKLAPTTITDPTQKKIMTIMLTAFTVFFLWFPSGLVLYYIISNVITIIQQHIIYHGLSKKNNMNIHRS
ncbi:inner membrane protein [Candidatus Blochmanniella vafra str. BVAF]|uniref:Multifunctional fusion protein n=1 Tax=Blochmanniella vafra (strain BVAF) TaxID=859654 RepID=E8Q5V7_BLOVB|nr:membrane protein insertase YidC [Candidatus Blochmannia vafer]ADV33426.1 inner membrane protein [Candidatus Blochmannia vafer str. BVAF]